MLKREEYERLTSALERAMQLLGRRRQTEQTLRESNVETFALLRAALHQLAAERGKKDHDHFTRRWLAEHRRPDTAGVPFSKGGGV